MTGEQFLDRLRAAIDPVTIARLKSPRGELSAELSDGRTIKISRSRVRDARNTDELSAYVAELVG